MTEIVDKITEPSQLARDAIAAGPISDAAFQAAFDALPCLHQIACPEPPPPPSTLDGEARILFWNAERLKYLEPSILLLRHARADAILLCEVDLGMARSGNLNTIEETADALDAGYVFGVEFVELDLGDARERKWHAGRSNDSGLHGAGLVSPFRLERPGIVRLERSGRWFDGALGERRVGGRMAVMAELTLTGGRVLLVSVHYESHVGPDFRLAQTKVLLDAIDAHAPGMPVLIGGDFNTSTFEIDRTPDVVAKALQEDPSRLLLPMHYEPMFKALKARGYDWETCNALGATTQRMRPDGTPKPPFGRIDWFFSRGLECRDAVIIPAVDSDGTAISDHEALAVTIRPAGG